MLCILLIHLSRFSCSENKEAYRSLLQRYEENVVGKVLAGIYQFHANKATTYSLDSEAEKVFENIVDKFNDQYNLKYTSLSQLTASQPDLDGDEKSELSVRTKATEIIGRLACVLWVYCEGISFINLVKCMHLICCIFGYMYLITMLHFTAFLCVLSARDVNIKNIVAAKYIRFAEEIAEISYAQSETFSPVSIQRTTEQYLCISR